MARVLVPRILATVVIAVASSSADADFFMSSFTPRNRTISVDEGDHFDLWCNADRDCRNFMQIGMLK